MWNRRELKARGKAAFKANYWMAVLAALILVFATGGSLGATSGSAGAALGSGSGQIESAETDKLDLKDVISGDTDSISSSLDDLKEILSEPGAGKAVALVAAIIIGVVALVGTVSLVVKILLLNPLVVSCQNFFVRNSERPAELNDLGRGFTPNWGGNVKTMLLRDLFLFLWSLLFVIPGIVKSYSYRMVPYILADHPEMSGTEVITLSRQMMRGYKWRAFVLDLSFLGWYILSAFTFFLLSIFYVNPYKHSTDAELYKALKNEF